jgi:hypothetical protein
MQILEDIAKVGHPWCAEDDADVGAHVHPEGIYLELLASMWSRMLKQASR